MRSGTLLAAFAAAGVSAETVVGVYILSRHGDRTAKSTPPVNFTDLGYEEVFTSGTYFRNRYISSDATNKIWNIQPDLVKLAQISAIAPVDNVLQSSANGFLQGLYPPVGDTLGSNTLGNGTVVTAPLGGYQLIPLQTLSSGTGSESASWLQGASSCLNAAVSSNDYFLSPQYKSLLNSTQSFYNGVAPMINSTFTASQTSFKNAYSIFDLLNVASIHNATWPSMDLLTNETFFQLRTLADIHEFNLAYNNTDPVRAVAGASIAGQVLQALNGTITGNYSNKLNIQFNAYGPMQSFFGLANLTLLSEDFYGVPDYASTLTWELVTNATINSTVKPTPDQLAVRFYFHNGTTSNISTPTEFSLFNSGVTPLPWSQFVSNMSTFAITSQAQWCQACGNSTGVCSSDALNNAGGSGNSSSSSSSGSGSSSGSHMSLAVAGVIGAMVTLGVVLGLEALILLVGGLAVVSKKRLRNGAATSGSPSVSQTKA